MFQPPSSIDTLYDYRPLLHENPLAQLPIASIGKQVAVIGSGPSGLLAAHELLKMGLEPVIFEARNRMGGRLYSMPFTAIEEKNPPFAEMGAMRIPQTSHIFLHYAKKLNLSTQSHFPNPGEVKTAIGFKNKLYHWEAFTALPRPFSEIKLLWHLFVDPLVNQIHAEWAMGNRDVVRQLWQMYINQYKHMSLYQAILERSSIDQSNLIDMLGAIGLGHGGFSSLFNISFLEILRLLVNGYIGNDFIINEGVSEFINRLYALKVETPLGFLSLADKRCMLLNRPVVLMDYNKQTGNPIIVAKYNHQLEYREFSAVIFSGSLTAAQLINITSKTPSGVYLLRSNVRNSIRTSPMIASSKTFICTKTKFWLEKNLPSCILTDDINRTTYFLDYPNTQHGVICLSYTWAFDSIKLQGIEPKDRVILFKRALSQFYPNLTHYLVPMHEEVLNIDWGNEPYQNGAFRIFTPGDDGKQQAIYMQFLSVLTPEDKGVYLAGDGVSWSGGWVEGALYTAINAVHAVAKRLGAEFSHDSPLSQNHKMYTY